MKYSKLKHELEILELNHKHELELLKMEHEQAKKALSIKCTHTYEDGTPARATKGSQWDSYSVCDICGRSL